MSTAQLQLEADWDEFCRLEAGIQRSEEHAITERWHYGKMLLRYEPGIGGRGKTSELGDVVRALGGELGITRAELFDRRLFADIYDTEEKLSTCIDSLKFWSEIRKRGLGNRGQGETPPLPESEYRCITIDPPWPVEKFVREVRPAQGPAIDYATMSVEEIDELVGQVVQRQDGCHVYLWATHRFVPSAFELFESWGVKYECVLTWVKNVGPTPFSWMYDTEHVLFGRRGSLSLEKQGMRLSFQANAIGHSIKPDVFYERVAEASPGPRLAMFERGERDGFEVWGDEVAA